MKGRTLKPVLTEDGSYTFFYQELNEHYHSLDGALSESQYVYIENGLAQYSKSHSELNVFEIGLGTGLNVFLSHKWANENEIKVNYFGIEPFPIDSALIEKIIPSSFTEEESNLFRNIHSNDTFESMLQLGSYFRLTRYESKIENFEINPFNEFFNVIYFDAFAPSRQAEIWNLENVKKCYKMLKKNGILTTYSATGQFKRNLKEAGFSLEKLKGFSSKREMFRGIRT